MKNIFYHPFASLTREHRGQREKLDFHAANTFLQIFYIAFSSLKCDKQLTPEVLALIETLAQQRHGLLQALQDENLINEAQAACVGDRIAVLIHYVRSGRALFDRAHVRTENEFAFATTQTIPA